MKLILIFASFLIFSSCSIQSVESLPLKENLQSPTPAQKPSVLVELFTSEGCSSCPPADRALALLQKEQPVADAEIIALAFHVDYWNRLGWKDEFSSDVFTRRQNTYSKSFRIPSIYTPQMVVDGRFQFVGSNLARAKQMIAEASQTNKAEIELTLDGKKLGVRIPDIPAHNPSIVYLAIAEDNLVSNVDSGENAGKKLEHIAVVRELRKLGHIKPNDTAFSVETHLEIKENWVKDNLKIVVFVQENSSRKIYGMQQTRFTPQPTN